MKYQKPINSVQNSDDFSSGLMEAYGKWMGGDCFQNTQPVDLNLQEAFMGMSPQSHGAEIEKTTTKKKYASKESDKAQLATKEEYEVLEREEYEIDGVTYVIEKAKGLDGKACWKGYKLAGTKKKGGKTVDNCVKAGYEADGEEDLQEKNGLYANIHAKRKRGESPAKPGHEDYPAKDAFKKAAKTAKKEEYDVDTANQLWSEISERLEKLGEMDNVKFKVIGEKLDPVGKEDGDIDNDGDKDKSDSYLHARRKKIGKILAMKGKK